MHSKMVFGEPPFKGCGHMALLTMQLTRPLPRPQDLGKQRMRESVKIAVDMLQ